MENVNIPKGIYRQKKQLASGEIVTYYRLRENGQRINGEPGTPEFALSLDLARGRASKPEQIYSRRLHDWAKEIARASKYRAKARGLEYDITAEYVSEVLIAQNRKCAITGLPFEFKPVRKGARGPLHPSVDRINCKRGYVIGNVRVVCLAINIALNEWGEDVFLRIAGAALAAARQRPLTSLAS